MRAAIYTRVSTQEQAEHGVSLEMQAEACRAAALRAGAETIEVFEDGGFSGTSLQRPALSALRSRLGEFDCLYVWKLDRLSRSVKGFADLMTEFSDAGVGFASVTEAVDYSGSAGRLMMHMLAAVAAFFADLNRERVCAALKHRTDQGLQHGQAPYGYRQAGKGEPMEVVPEEAEVVGELFLRYAQGATLGQLMRDLNARRVPGPRGSTSWQYRTIRRLLERRTYLGEVRQGDLWLPGQHEPLVEPETFAACHRRLATYAGISPRARLNSLSPLFRCGLCGGPMLKGRMGKGHARFSCQQYTQDHTLHEPCGVGAEKAEAAVWAYAEWLLTEGHFREAVAEAARQQRAQRTGGEAAAWRKRVRELDAQLARLLKAYGLGTMPDSVYLEETRPLAAERQELMARLEALEGETDLRELRRSLPRNLGEALERLRSQSADVQVAAFRQLFSEVRVFPGTLEFVGILGDRYRMPLPALYQPKRGVGRFPMPDGSLAR